MRKSATILAGLAALGIVLAAVVAIVLQHRAERARRRLLNVSTERQNKAAALVRRLCTESLAPGQGGSASTTMHSMRGFDEWCEKLVMSYGDRAHGAEVRVWEYENEEAAEEALEKVRRSLEGSGVERPTGIPSAFCRAMEVPPKDVAYQRQVDVVLGFVVERCFFQVARSLAGAAAPAKLEDAPLPSEETVRAFAELIVPGGGGTRPLRNAR